MTMLPSKSDPRKARTLDEACKNADGTYNGVRLLSWLSGLSEQTVREEWQKAKQRHEEKLSAAK